MCSPKVSKGRSESPLVAPAGAKPLLAEKSHYGRKANYVVAPIWRDNVQVVGKASWGARLRTRKVTGRDASLPALLRASSFELVARGAVGALPQTPPEALPLDSARGRRKGTKSPLDPFRAIELFSLPYFFRVLLFCSLL